MTRNKRISIIFCIILAVVIVGSIVVSAFFTANDGVVNNFTVADPKVTVVEDPEDGPYDWGSDTKKVSLRNDSKNLDGYVRCSIFPLVKNTDGNIQNVGTSAFSEPVNNVAEYGDFTFYFASDWQNNWVYADGYFYYKNKLKVGEVTSTLLTGVGLKDGVNAQNYKDLTAEVQVLADIIQGEAIVKDDAWSAVQIADGKIKLK